MGIRVSKCLEADVKFQKIFKRFVVLGADSEKPSTHWLDVGMARAMNVVVSKVLLLH